MNDLQHEWTILHGDIEKYERLSLLIKLFSILVSVLSFAHHLDIRFAVAIIFVLWLQDGIWKTFQKRLESRILLIEHGLHHEAEQDDLAFQLYSQWQEKRQGVVSLVKEYILNSAKPTVAYPYALLVLLTFFFL